MPTVKWTDAQRTAIEARGNILVSAAAGSGKTATLTARIIKLLREDKISLRDMLIVTFTKAAAGELRARIGRELAAAAATDGSMARHLAALPSAEICTIHSYCHSLLRRNFSRLSLTPDFGIADGAEGELMMARAMEDTVDDFFRGELVPGGERGEKSGDADKGNVDDELGKGFFGSGAADSPEKAVKEPGGGICEDADIVGNLNSGAEDYADIIAVADTLGKTRDAAGLDAALRSLYGKLRSLGLGSDWLDTVAAELDAGAEKDFFDTSFGGVIREELHLAASHYRRVIGHLRDCIADDEAAAEKYLPAAASDAEYLTRLEMITEHGGYGEIKEALGSYEAVKLGSLAAVKKIPEAAMYQSERNSMKKAIAKLAARHFSVDEADIAESMRGSARILRSAAEILRVFDERFAAMKRERNVLDYSDLEIYALKLLEAPDGSPSDAALEEGVRFKFVFIDEYQDTNSVQDRIFRAVSCSAERFFVGDIKQSIYRFRGAEPEVFSGYRQAWGALDSGENGTEETTGSVLPGGEPLTADGSTGTEYPPGHSIFMSENFRCAEPIINFVNSVSRYMFPDGGVPFSEEDCLRFGGGETETAPVEVCLISKPGRKKAGDGDPPDGVEVSGNTVGDNESDGSPVADPEAEYVASRVAELVRGGERPGNIAILFRSLASSGAVYEDALARRGIPVKSTGSRPFMEESEVVLVFSLLRAVDNPLRDVELAGAMCSSVFGFSLDDLVRVRLSDRTSPLWYTVRKYSESGGDEALREKCGTLFRRISALREAERGMSADRFIEHLFFELDVFSSPEVTEKPCGEANLHTIRDAASEYESGMFGGLYGFLRFAEEKLAERGAASDGGNENAVTVMTVHSSKGLEFPVCILAGTGKERNGRDEDENLLLHRSLGVAMRLPDPGGLVRCGNPMRTAVSELMRRESVEEEMRILYVALTRARRRLIVTAAVPKAEEQLEKIRMGAPFADRYTKSRTVHLIDHIMGAAVTDGGGGCTVTVIPYQSVLNMESPDAAAEAEGAAETETATLIDTERIRKSLEFEYPYGYLSGIPSKLSVSRLYPSVLDADDGAAQLDVHSEGEASDAQPGMAQPDSEQAAETATGEKIPVASNSEASAPNAADVEDAPRPRFMTGSTDTSPAERGTSTHVVLQFADFAALCKNGVRAELSRLVSRGFITEKMAAMVSIPQVERFAHSKLMARMERARRLVREHRFNVIFPAADFTENEELREKLRESGETITVQGVFDCVMEDEDGKLVLVDYKTDSLTAFELTHPYAAAEKLIGRHKKQLSYYAEACRILFGRLPDETYIYSLPLGDTIRVI